MTMQDTLVDYDAVPYESFPILDTSPDRLACIGDLFGLEAPDPRRARILEIGCASGGNLLPLAAQWPESHCVGVELSRVQAQLGQSRIHHLHFTNCEIRQENILEVPLDGEPFDYIVAHGVYSWVPPPVRQHILALCGRRLSAQGIAYINYNCLPGWNQRQLLREMLLHHVRMISDPLARLRAAREFLEFLSLPLDHPPPGHDTLHKELQYLRQARDSYLYHEYLEGCNTAFLFHDFIADAESAGLQYLADAQLHSLFTDTLGAPASNYLDTLQDLLQEEQYADFLRLRGHRQTLLCRKEIPLHREIDLDTVLEQPVWCDLEQESGDQFRNASGQRFRIRDREARKAVMNLQKRFPQAHSLRELLSFSSENTLGSGSRPTASPAGNRNRPTQAVPSPSTGIEWFNLIVSGALQITRIPVLDPDSDTGRRWKPFLQCLLQEGEHYLPTLRHQSIHLDDSALTYCRSLIQSPAKEQSQQQRLDNLLRRHGIALL